MSHVYLVGFMGSGKSAVGRELAARSGMPFVDLDRVISAEAGASIPEVFASRGEVGFRDLETDALGSLPGEPASVVACGGGIVCRDRNREVLSATGTVVWLRVSPAESLRRVGGTSGRPLLDGASEEEAARLLSGREALYGQVADVTVDTDGKPIADVADEVERALTGVSR